MAPWPSGKAEACKAFTPGSNPGGASKIVISYKLKITVLFRRLFLVLKLVVLGGAVGDTELNGKPCKISGLRAVIK